MRLTARGLSIHGTAVSSYQLEPVELDQTFDLAGQDATDTPRSQQRNCIAQCFQNK